MKKTIIYTLLLSFCFVSLLTAQEDIDENTETIKGRKNAISFSAGLPGYGIEYSRKLSNKLSARLRYNFFNLEDYDAGTIEISGNNVIATVGVESNTIDVLLEFTPFKNSSFKLVGGLGVINNMNINLLVEYDESVTFGDVVITKEDYGNLNLGFAWDGVAPYLGVGFGRAVPKGKLGFGIEMGSYFTSSPDISLTATKLLAPTANQEAQVAQTFETWKFIPLVQFRLAYAF